MRHDKLLMDKTRSLLKLHEQRIRRLEMDYLGKRKLFEEAKEAYMQRLESITQLKQQRSGLFRFLEQEEVINQPAQHERVDSRRYWIEYDLEKDEYYLDMDKGTMNEAEVAMIDARKEWLHARSRKGGVEKLMSDQRQKNERLAEFRVDMEMEESLSGRVKAL